MKKVTKINLESTDSHLRKVLMKQIPIAKLLKIRQLRLNVNEVRFVVAKTPSRNHVNHAFGGAIASAQALAGWAWVVKWLESQRGQNIRKKQRIVMGECHIQFSKPLLGEFVVVAQAPSLPERRQFLKSIDEKGKGRLSVQIAAFSEDEVSMKATGGSKNGFKSPVKNSLISKVNFKKSASLMTAEFSTYRI